MMRTLFLFFAALFFVSFLAFSQDSTYVFEANNFRWIQSTDGSLFYDKPNARPGFEAPIGNGTHTIFAHTFLISARAPNGDSVMVNQMFCQVPELENCVEVWGPLKTDLSQNDSAYIEQYNRFWFIKREELETNQAYFDCSEDPNCNVDEEFPGYEIPEAFMSWPAMGDTDQGYATYLAPFYDRNGDGEYQPEYGDQPMICGDFSVYGITNDVGTQNKIAQYPAMGLEIHTQVYGYDADPVESADLFNTLFVRHRLINRSDAIYEEAYVGSFIEYDVGDPQDDYIATDVQRSMAIGYNGGNFDGASANGPGYGYDLPAMGVKVLAGPFKDPDGLDNPSISPDFQTYGSQGPGWGDGIADNERWGLAHSLYTTVNNWPYSTYYPSQPYQLHYLLSGRWYTNDPFTYGGWGYGGTVPSRYFFPGDSDPLLFGTYGIDPEYGDEEGWSEESESHSATQRNMMASSGPFTFQPGDVQYYDYAMVFARESQEPGVDVRETLGNRADAIQEMLCDIQPQITTGLDDKETSRGSFVLYPNPSQSEMNIRFESITGKITVEIFDALGRKIGQHTADLNGQNQTMSWDVAGAPGIYLVNVTGDDFSKSQRWVKAE